MVEPLGLADPAEISGYVLRGKLGEGGMGSVYLSHSRGGQPVALKVIRQEFAQDPEFLRRFAREVQAARRVQGAYTAAVLDSSTEGPQPWLASAYVPGPSLARAVFEHGPLSLRTVLLLTAGVAEALQAIHAVDVVHRDLKPTNVLLAADGPRVIDFGIARSTDATALTGTDMRLGTPAYMSPEQAEGKPVTSALDVFALGLLAHFASTGGHPFGEGGGHALLYRIVAQEPDLAECPEPLRPLIARCLAKEPTDRAALSEIIEECHRIAAAEGTTLTRGEDWWQPAPVASPVAECMSQHLVASLPPAPPSYRPTAKDGQPQEPAARDPRLPYEPGAADPQETYEAASSGLRGVPEAASSGLRGVPEAASSGLRGVPEAAPSGLRQVPEAAPSGLRQVPEPVAFAPSPTGLAVPPTMSAAGRPQDDARAGASHPPLGRSNPRPGGTERQLKIIAVAVALVVVAVIVAGLLNELGILES
ncbi:protein kinase domain-containing protein [Streptomyces europaeiscabiei]|uniref:protein kinase domain-containing protein n=1 Tax=Streptomyces europaeiscabiei TaxID=146819 RepID=UPI002E268683|nr:protein kinase [Streptomyces europaeiscabiei]